MKILYLSIIVIAVAVTIGIVFSIQLHNNNSVSSSNFIVREFSESYYTKPITFQINDTQIIGNVAFIVKGHSPITGNECNEESLNLVSQNYQPTEIMHFIITINSTTKNIDQCWPPPRVPFSPPLPGNIPSPQSLPNLIVWFDSSQNYGVLYYDTTFGSPVYVVPKHINLTPPHCDDCQDAYAVPRK